MASQSIVRNLRKRPQLAGPQAIASNAYYRSDIGGDPGPPKNLSRLRRGGSGAKPTSG